MQVDLFDTAKFIQTNNLREVSDPMMFIKGSIPSPKGLLSTDIFGVSMVERKETFAYIDLHGTFLHPYIYKTLKRLNRNFVSLIHGSKRFIIDESGALVENENGETGLDFLYKNWEKLKFEGTEGARGLRVNVLKNYKKNELFTKYWIVIPAFYRDVNFENADSGKISHRSEINDKYTKLIRLASMLTTGTAFDFTLLSTQAKLQETLVEIEDMMRDKLSKKEGMFRKNLLGKSVDYGARSVISAPTFKANRASEMPINYYNCGVPLSQCCSLFNPFIVAWVKNFFRQKFETANNKFPVRDKDGNTSFVELDEPEMYFTEELIKKEIDNYIKNFEDRFKVITVPVKGREPIPFTMTTSPYIKGDPMSEKSMNSRPMTWCDVLYQAAVDVTSDKHVYITRYPISDYFSIFPNRIFVMSTAITKPMIVGDRVYEHYPDIDLSKDKREVGTMFIDTVRMSNLYLAGLNGDYDGDQISIRGVFTQEANEEAERLLTSKSSLITIEGQNIRKSAHEAILTLYAMTSFE